MAIYLVIVIQAVLIAYCILFKIISQFLFNKILSSKKKYNANSISILGLFSFSSSSIFICSDEINILIIGTAIMFFLCGILFLVEASENPYFTDKGLVFNCRLYKWEKIGQVKVDNNIIYIDIKSKLIRMEVMNSQVEQIMKILKPYVDNVKQLT